MKSTEENMDWPGATPGIVAAFVLMLLGIGASMRADNFASVEGSVQLPQEKHGAPAPRYGVRSGTPAAAPSPFVAVVYLEGSFPPATNKTVQAEMRQEGLQFIPRVLPVQKGTRVIFPNSDTEYHNVLSYSKAKEFDLGRYLKSESPPGVVFDKPGPVELDCEIHAHMRATILVLETPHFTTTDSEGRYRLDRLPSGQFVLKAWLGPKKILEKPITLEPGKTASADFVQK